MKTFSFLILLAFATTAAFAELPKYTFKDLGTLGGDESYAYAINNKGQVVGRADDESGLKRAVIFDVNGQGNNIDLGTLDGGSGESWAYAINNNGQVVGHDYDEYGMDRAVLFDATGAGNNISLGSLGGVTGGAQSINDNGVIVGWSATTPDEYYYSNWHATLFDATGNGQNVDLDKTACYLSVARCVNKAGLIAGNSEETAMLFDNTGMGNNTDIGAFLTGDFSTVLAMNESGKMVGYGNTQPGYYHHAMLFTAANGTVTALDLGGLDGTRSYATSINATGQIVGYARTASGVYHATWFDATGAGKNIDLNLGWELNSAYINDKGQICGYGKTATGMTHAFLLTPIVVVVEEKPVVKQVTVKAVPCVLNLANKPKWVMVTVQLPAACKVGNINKATIKLDGTAKPDWTCFISGGNRFMARFTTNSLPRLSQTGKYDLVLTAAMKDGKSTITGKDSITVYKPVPKKPVVKKPVVAKKK
jgi:probable HAF family extracellular repeat protein